MDGLYTMKAGYKLLVNDELNSNGGASSGSMPKGSWKGLWQLKTPNRIKNLLWCANSDALPTRVNLVKWKSLLIPLARLAVKLRSQLYMPSGRVRS